MWKVIGWTFVSLFVATLLSILLVFFSIDSYYRIEGEGIKPNGLSRVKFSAPGVYNFNNKVELVSYKYQETYISPLNYILSYNNSFVHSYGKKALLSVYGLEKGEINVKLNGLSYDDWKREYSALNLRLPKHEQSLKIDITDGTNELKLTLELDTVYSYTLPSP
ncbi:hypothetical protein [Amphritea balenae]|uniref:Uncharacterized protein n=1 Tax=Amphritea balenae TaxID=452629 RepID=A0A3P1SR30_9GAMM|nr:hypothetical protein [Amphritea balenae]RRC98622.1 hypothetical protein EHS89_13505 [Amphritea balenae]GGK66037.1 hypothetical protein GCM10007941_15300 [Amphritea balenae]